MLYGSNVSKRLTGFVEYKDNLFLTVEFSENLNDKKKFSKRFNILLVPTFLLRTWF